MKAKYKQLEELMKGKGMTANELSRRTGISTPTLSHWKTGRSVPKVDKLQILADYFGVSLEYFLKDE